MAIYIVILKNMSILDSAFIPFQTKGISTKRYLPQFLIRDPLIDIAYLPFLPHEKVY